MVIEHLMVRVAEADRPGYLAADAEHWTAFLSAQDGFVRKETWVDDDDPETLHLLVWWETREQWKRITMDQVAEVDERMGPWFRDPVVREYRRLA